MGKQKKFYVVWKGRTTGIFESWGECKRETNGFPGAKFKSFKSRQFAEQALQDGSEKYIRRRKIQDELTEDQLKRLGNPEPESIAVDAAWNKVSGIMEYRAVYVRNEEEVFYQGPFEGGTNNIGEFLALVHALAYCKKANWDAVIYSDSRSALSWVRVKGAPKHFKSQVKNEVLFNIIKRAEKWLRENNYSNQIVKWESRAWGENPAEF
jgi:ribonuclease HI